MKDIHHLLNITSRINFVIWKAKLTLMYWKGNTVLIALFQVKGHHSVPLHRTI